MIHSRPEPVATSATLLRPSRSDLAREVAALPDDARLTANGPFEVLLADATQAPQCVLEIGTLRAEVFPESCRGGSAIDLDEFDDSYEHLFVWNAREREIVGAYRIARSDRVKSPTGFYTNTLFDFDQPLVERLRPAIELGRSFVRPEHQRSFAPLHMLWRGLGELIAREKRYTHLFGALTIHNGFHKASRDLLLDFLELHSVTPDLRRMVSPRCPVDREPTTVPDDLKEISRRVREIEGRGGRDVPILMKHYHRLGARAFDFSVDEDFGGSVDALVMVEILNIPRPILQRYLGDAGAAAYLAYHEARERRSSRR